MQIAVVIFCLWLPLVLWPVQPWEGWHDSGGIMDCIGHFLAGALGALAAIIGVLAFGGFA